MSKIVKIYCEGVKKGHDKAILEKVIEGLPQILIEPIGGIRGANAIMQYKEAHEVVKSDFYLLFRDRDFDKPIPAIPTLEQDDLRNKVYYSYRNTIENYLFDISTLLVYCKHKQLFEEQNLTEETIKQILIQAAEKIKYYQAVRHTMGRMRTGDTNFGTKITPKSGKLPSSLDEEFCKKEGLGKIISAKTITDKWTEEIFEKNYLFFLSKFDENFMKNLSFLAYFHGKDFATAFKSIMPDGFQLENYYMYAKKNFDYTKHPDLLELRQLIINQQSV